MPDVTKGDSGMDSTDPAESGTRRYYMVDLDFFHKQTFDRLYDQFGPAGPLVWLALIAEAKRSRIPGTVTVTNEPDFWRQLGFQGRDVGFTMDEFLAFTGRYKQTSRTPLGRLQNVLITHFGEWQKRWRRESERERKARTRQENTRDTTRTGSGHDADRERDRERDNPLPPSQGTPKTEIKCDLCRNTYHSAERLEQHRFQVHGIDPLAPT